MTDKPVPPLNLIERMAQRLEKEAASQPSANVIGRAMERDPLESAPALKNGNAPAVTMREALSAPIQAPVQQAPRGVAAIGPAATAHAPVPPAARRPEQPQMATPPGKTVRLDFRALRQNGLITPDNMTSAISNEFRGIKRRLLQKVRDPQTRAAVSNLIMVTSSLPGEGKTFSSINLALSLAAERGLQVLLIDADVIRPSVGNISWRPPMKGLLIF